MAREKHQGPGRHALGGLRKRAARIPRAERGTLAALTESSGLLSGSPGFSLVLRALVESKLFRFGLLRGMEEDVRGFLPLE